MFYILAPSKRAFKDKDPMIEDFDDDSEGSSTSQRVALSDVAPLLEIMAILCGLLWHELHDASEHRFGCNTFDCCGASVRPWP